ncbi:hypothetical protein S245_033516 [Arachis hypogaea]
MFFVASPEPCPAELARHSRMLPLARTLQGVRGAVRPGVLGLRTVVADEWCAGRWCVWLLASRTERPR